MPTDSPFSPSSFPALPSFPALIVAGALSVLSGCAVEGPSRNETTAPPPAPASVESSVNTPTADHCAALNALDTKTAAVALDLHPALMEKLRRSGHTDNAGVCAMPEVERVRLLGIERNAMKIGSKHQRVPAQEEYLKLWYTDEFGRTPNSDDILRAEAHRQAMAADTEQQRKVAGITSATWSSIGPSNVGGRIRSIVIDPRDPNRIFIGSVTGGIWRSSDGGQTFVPANDLMGSLSIGSLAINPVNPDIMYAGTGEGFTQNHIGAGIFRSTDGGINWSHLASTSTNTAVNPNGLDWTLVNRIAVHPINPNIILAATANTNSTFSGALFRSTDGGQNWAKLMSNVAVMDVKFDPNDPNNAVAYQRRATRVHYSRDAGATWTPSANITVTPTTGNSQRIELAYSKSDPGMVYASIDNNKGEVWKSADGGANWMLLSTPAHLNNQGEYDNTIWVSPTDPALIVVGGLDLYRSIDGGANFTQISRWQSAFPGLPQPHADHHIIVSAPNYSESNRVVYFGNDGGLYKSTDIRSAGSSGTTSWVNLNGTLGITQFYGAAGSLAAGGRLIGGTQDNGTLQKGTGTTWSTVFGGDGGYSAVDPVDDSTNYGEYVYAAVHRTLNGGTRGYICTGITEAYSGGNCGSGTTQQALFIAPFIVDPNNRDRLLVGANSLWVSNNVRATTPTWIAIKPPLGSSGPFIGAIAMRAGDPDTIWVGHTGGQVYKTTNGQAATPTWTQMGAGTITPANISRITIDPSDGNRVWVVLTGYNDQRIWQTTDGGMTWTSIHGNLPQVSFFDIKRHPAVSNLLYAAADNGVYASADNGATWSTTNDGPVATRVRELFWYDNNTLIAATYGRGLFQASVVPPNVPGNLQFVTAAPRVSRGSNATLTVSRGGGSTGAVSVNYATTGGTAVPGADYTPASGTINWANGDIVPKTITITTGGNGSGTKTVDIVLSAPGGGASLGTPATATLTITDPDAFPSGCSPPAGFSVPAGANAGWNVATDSTYEGACSLKSATILDNQKAQIQYSGAFTAGTVSFARRVSSESTWDCLRFLIDGVQQNIGSNCSGIGGIGASGEVAWGVVNVPITAGAHTLTWSYEKDPNTISGADAAWIDALSLPLAAAAGPTVDYSDMWWVGAAENGWGMSIQQHANGVQFNALYIYDAQGQPRWYVMPGGTWSNNFTTFSGPLYQPTGSPLNNYNANQLVVGASPGTLTLNFTGNGTATMSYTINGISGTKTVVRQPFTGGTAPFTVGDMWWVGSAENGWGVSIVQHNGTLFAVWYTYGPDGKPLWYVMPGGGTWNGNTYSAPLYATTGSPWLGATYNPNALSVTQVGTISFNFSSANAATMSYNFTSGPFAGVNQSKPIVRQSY